MKKIVQLSILSICSIGFLSSCGSDDAAPPAHIVGTWKLQIYAIINVPATHSINEGRTYELDRPLFGIVIKSYELNLLQNGSFNREVSTSGVLPLEDSGTWELSDDGEELTLDSDNNRDDQFFGDYAFGVEKNENNNLRLSFPVENFPLLSNDVFSRFTQEQYDMLSQAERNNLIDRVMVDVVFVMKK